MTFPNFKYLYENKKHPSPSRFHCRQVSLYTTDFSAFVKFCDDRRMSAILSIIFVIQSFPDHGLFLDYKGCCMVQVQFCYLLSPPLTITRPILIAIWQIISGLQVNQVTPFLNCHGMGFPNLVQAG